MTAYHSHPEIGAIYPVVSVKAVGAESNVNGFFHPPCVPMSLLDPLGILAVCAV